MARSARKGISNKGEEGKSQDHMGSTKENESDNEIRHDGQHLPTKQN